MERSSGGAGRRAAPGRPLGGAEPRSCPPTSSYRSSAQWSADAIQRGPDDRLAVVGVSADRAGRDDQVEHLLEREVVANFSALLRRVEERLAGGEDARAAAVEDRVGPIGLLEQFGGNLMLVRDELCEAPHPRHQHLPRRVAGESLGGRADRVDLLDVERFQQLAAAGEVAVQRRHPDAGAPRDFGHRGRSAAAECRPCGRQDLFAVARGVGALLRRRSRRRGHGSLKWIAYPLRYVDRLSAWTLPPKGTA